MQGGVHRRHELAGRSFSTFYGGQTRKDGWASERRLAKRTCGRAGVPPLSSGKRESELWHSPEGTLASLAGEIVPPRETAPEGLAKPTNCMAEIAKNDRTHRVEGDQPVEALSMTSKGQKPRKTISVRADRPRRVELVSEGVGS